MRRAGVGSAEGPLWAAGGALGALEGHGQPRVRIFVDSALPAVNVTVMAPALCG